MPKYLFQVSLNAEGVMGTLKEGGTSRRAVIEKLIGDMGGLLEADYYAFGDTDVFIIADLPDNATSAALSMVISASGAASISTTVLIPPEEIDEAAQKTVGYRPPGA